MRGEFLDLPDGRIYYYAAGSRGAGEPIVLVHGFPASSHVWFDVVAKLPPGHRVVVSDQLGFGRSDAPAEADYGIAAHGRRILEMLDALVIDRACLVGHEIGAEIARWVATNAPQRVSRIVVVDSAATSGWLSTSHHVGRRFRSALLHLPSWCWLPLARWSIARTYDDRSLGLRSAEVFLLPFASVSGAAALRRHLRDLAGVGVRRAVDLGSLDIPALSIRSDDHRFSPEEYPSEVAAGVARVLSLGG